jgi:hypothetical protein
MECARNVARQPRSARAMPDLIDDPEYRLTLRQADQAREDFAAILDELDFVKGQLSRLPTRAWLSRMMLLGFGSVWALLAAVVLLITR